MSSSLTLAQEVEGATEDARVELFVGLPLRTVDGGGGWTGPPTF